MKNILTLTGGIILSASFLFTGISAIAQDKTNADNAKTYKEWVWKDEGLYRKELKNDGIPAATIEKIIEKRKELMFSGRKVNAIHHSVDIREKQNPAPLATCSDMGGENGWGSWVARTGDFAGSLPIGWSGALAPTSPRFNLTSGAGVDACTPGPAAGAPPIPVVAPGFGNASLQIGEIQTNGLNGGCLDGCAEQLTYPLFVTAQDTNFTFTYAVVLENPPGHTAAEQPFVSLNIYDSNGTPIPCGSFTYVAAANLPGFYTSACNVNSVSYYKPWTLVGINLNPYIGQTLTIEIINADCALSGHFAQSYWDFSCGTLSTASQYCVGEDSVLLTAPLDPTYSYSWSTGGSTSSIIVNPQLTDTVILYIVPGSGCGYYEVYTLQPTIINTAMTYTVNCNKVTFTDNTTISGGTISGWAWSFPGGSPVSAGTQNPGIITYPTTGGTYTASLTVSSQAGCTDTTVYVPITILPPPTFAATNATICQSNSGVLCAAGTGLTYVWNPTGQTTTCITVTTASASNYTITGTDAGGCVSIATAHVYPAPLPVITAVSGTVCATPNNGVCATLTASGAATYTWSPTTYLSSAFGNAVLSCATSATTYTVYGTDGSGCSNTGIASVGITPKPNVSALPPSTICFGQTTANISAVTSSIVTYLWSPSTGLSCTTCPNPIANPASTNTYTVLVTDGNGCTNTASVPVVVGAIPQISAIASPSVCTGSTALLNANVSNVPASQLPVHWNWYPPNSPPLSSDTAQNPTITPNTTTNLSVVVTDAYGCKDTAYATVYVVTIPSVSWTQWTPYITCDGYVVPLMANVSDNGSSVYWTFGDNSNLTQYQPSPGGIIWTSAPPAHIYDFNGVYNVSVVAINSICRDTIDTTFSINDIGRYLNILPANVFTPNSDGINDCFHPAMDIQNVPNITSPDSLKKVLAQCVDMEVWDRWGVKMFESSDTEKCWDGTTKGGTPAKEGTYFYIAKFKDLIIKGNVALLRSSK